MNDSKNKLYHELTIEEQVECWMDNFSDQLDAANKYFLESNTLMIKNAALLDENERLQKQLLDAFKELAEIKAK